MSRAPTRLRPYASPGKMLLMTTIHTKVELQLCSRWANLDVLKTLIPHSFHPPRVSIPNPSGQESLQRNAPSLSTACATFKVILGNMGFFWLGPVFSHHLG